MNAKQLHSLSYPYVNVDVRKQKSLADILEQNYFYQDCLLQSNPSSSSSFNSIAIGIRYIIDSSGINLQTCIFVDTMGNGGSAAFYASSFGFKSVKSIEFSESSLKIAQEVFTTIQQDSKYGCNVSLISGSMQDYFAFDADVVYCDCTFATMDSMIDEACILTILFKMCKKLLAGSFILVVTHGLELTTLACAEMGFPFLDCVHRSVVDYEVTVTSDEFDQDIDTMTLWVLKKRVLK